MFDLLAVDSNGNEVSNIEIDPERARVRIAVARELANRTLPVVPMLIGELAPGYRISAITVEPLVVTVSGEEGTVTRLESAPTQPIDIEGRTTDLAASIGLDLPPDISVNGSDQVTVMLTIEQEIGVQSFFIALSFVGTEPGHAYDLGADSPVVTLSGPVATLDALDPITLVGLVDLSGLPEGSHSVDVAFAPPAGLDLVSMEPEQVFVASNQARAASPPP